MTYPVRCPISYERSNINRDDIAYIIEHFLSVKSRNCERHGTYRKDLILNRYDALVAPFSRQPPIV